MMLSKHVTVLAIAIAAVTAVDARAQETIVVRGLGVGTFGSFNSTGLLGVGIGVNLSEVLQVTFDASREFGRADPYRRPVAPSTVIGIPTAIIIVLADSARVDRVVTGGVRFRLPTSFRLKPFAAVHAGLVRVTTRFVPGSIADEGSIDWRTLVEGEGGISISVVNRLAVEMSYRVGSASRDYDIEVVQSVGLGVAVGF
jgi:hypothetical protein